MKKIFLFAFAALVIGILLIQLIPYGRNHNNPPVVQEPVWVSAEVRSLAEKACFDCHSNETKWPWYSNIAPVSWLVMRDIQEGREHLNFSEWGMGENESDDLVETIYEGEMPPANYVLLHSEANLSDGEKETLAQGLAQIPGVRTESEHEEDDD